MQLLFNLDGNMKTLISKLQKASFTNLNTMNVFTIDPTRPYIRNGKTVGFYVNGSTCCVFEIAILKYLFVHKFFNRGLSNIKLN